VGGTNQPLSKPDSRERSLEWEGTGSKYLEILRGGCEAIRGGFGGQEIKSPAYY